MGAKPNIIAETGLQFFGRISASISHELKNVLAIINENAGLLDDFTEMADHGMAIDPARLKKMAGVVAKQVGRANGILKCMNQFAHSIDETVIDVDLNEIIKLLIALTDRFAAMRSVAVETDLSADLIRIRTSPFLLMNLLWLCLDFALDASGAGHTVVVQTQKTWPGAQIHFKRIEGLAQTEWKSFPAKSGQELLDFLKAELAIRVEYDEILVKLP